MAAREVYEESSHLLDFRNATAPKTLGWSSPGLFLVVLVPGEGEEVNAAALGTLVQSYGANRKLLMKRGGKDAEDANEVHGLHWVQVMDWRSHTKPRLAKQTRICMTAFRDLTDEAKQRLPRYVLKQATANGLVTLSARAVTGGVVDLATPVTAIRPLPPGHSSACEQRSDAPNWRRSEATAGADANQGGAGAATTQHRDFNSNGFGAQRGGARGGARGRAGKDHWM